MLSKNECFIYQLIESCLKYDLEQMTALNVINLILEHYSYLFTTGDSKIISIEKTS
jgi:serine/threonine protein phosphatase PrpC